MSRVALPASVSLRCLYPLWAAELDPRELPTAFEPQLIDDEDEPGEDIELPPNDSPFIPPDDFDEKDFDDNFDEDFDDDDEGAYDDDDDDDLTIPDAEPALLPDDLPLDDDEPVLRLHDRRIALRLA